MTGIGAAETPPRIGIVGGGITGLTAAYRLTKLGYDVTLWERSSELGGLASAIDVPGGKLERFYHHLFMSDTAIISLMNDLGIRDRLLWLDSQNSYYSRGRVYSLASPTDLLRLPIVPLHDRIRIGLVTLYLQRITPQGERWKRFENVTAWEWMRRWLGERAFSRTFGAQLEAKFGPDAQEVAMVWLWNKIYLRTQSRPGLLAKEKLGYISGSFQTLVDALEQEIIKNGGQILLERTVEDVDRASDNRYVVTNSNGDRQEVDAILVTTPAPLFLRFFPDTPEPYRSQVTATPYQGAVCLILRLDRPLTDTYWMNIADRDVPLTVVVEHTNFVDGAEYDDNHYLYVNKYVDQNHRFTAMADEAVIEEYLSYLKLLNPEFNPSWVQDSWLFRAAAAQPVIKIGHRNNIPDHRTPFPGVYLATMSQIYPEDRGTNYAVALGNRAASLISSDFELRS